MEFEVEALRPRKRRSVVEVGGVLRKVRAGEEKAGI